MEMLDQAAELGVWLDLDRRGCAPADISHCSKAYPEVEGAFLLCEQWITATQKI